jgi:hypothetical protein
MPRKLLPDRQRDARGHMVLVGLTFEETREFRKLDASLPYDGQNVWPDQTLPMLPMEVRWLELWTKHQASRP